MKVDQFSKKNNILNLFFLSANKKKKCDEGGLHTSTTHTHTHTPMKLTTIKRNDYEKNAIKKEGKHNRN